MLDIKRIIKDQQEIETAFLKRGLKYDFNDVINNYKERNQILKEVESLKSNKNKLVKTVGLLKKQQQDSSALIAEMSINNKRIIALENREKELTKAINDYLIMLPNIPDPDVKKGGKEANEVIKTVGKQRVFSFPLKDHVTLGEELKLIDFTRGVKLGGYGNWVYTGLGAKLEWALLNYFIDFHFKSGYEFLLVPHLLNNECGYVAGQFPKFKEDVFVLKEGNFLLPTAETAIINYHQGEILKKAELPKKYFAYTPCYRREAGSHCTKERGTIRGHQFNKVEMFIFTTPELGEQMFNELVIKAETLMQGLGLHYQVSKLAAADVSASMAKTYDIEVWIPSMNEYKEVSSISNARDYQARRGQIKYQAETGKNEYVYTLNGSGLATSRLLPALLEQYQNEDGSITIPEVLRPYLGGLERLS